MEKKLVYRCDDIGYTEAFDMGAFKALTEGIGTSADVMLDSQHTIEALKWLKERPWISVGWHRHLWGWPVAGAENVPSMVNEEGKFKWRVDRKLQQTVTYEDAFREFEAELSRCKEYLGRYPDTAADVKLNQEKDWPINKAFKDICEKYGIAHSYCQSYNGYEVDPKYASAGYAVFKPASTDTAERRASFDLSYFKDYDPESKIMQITWDKYPILMTGGHPGFLDEYILKESSCTIHRVKDCEAACSNKVKQWIIDNKIELVNQKDAIYGTHEFQDHLKQINSPLWIGNMK